MICKVKQTIEKYKLITDDIKSVAVGFSGGADSVCLLDALTLFKDEYGIIIKAVHVNHNIRGEEAVNDEQFVKDFCKSRGIELLIYSVDVPLLAKQRKLGLEECGRQVRYECFDKAGCDAVAVAHTLSDSIETMLFNLARGTGAKGLAGISPKREPNIIRPLIACTRKEIEAYCSVRSLSFVTDSTNLYDDYTRNHIRHNIVPMFEKINTDFESSFLRAMNSIREEDDFVQYCASDVLKQSECADGYKLSVFQNTEKAVLKKCLLEILKRRMHKPPEAKHIDACYEMIMSGYGKIELAKDLYIFVDGDIISFCTAEKYDTEWKAYFKNNIADTPYGIFVLEAADNISNNSFDAGKIKETLYVSSRLPGDSFTFRKRGVTKSLKKLFNELKIPVSKRNAVVVLHDGGNVVWVEDIGVNAEYIPDENSEKIFTVKRTC